MKNNRFFHFALILLVLSALVACSGQPAQPEVSSASQGSGSPQAPLPTPQPVTPMVTLAAGGSITLSQVTPAPGATTGSAPSITLNDQGRIYDLAVGQSLVLQLGEEYSWVITISDDSVFSRVKNIAALAGSQGVYQALKPGSVTLQATGDPTCRQSKPACGRPSIQIQVTINVH